ncbi:hypothetical protein Rhsp01_58730 [Rhizobium sp. NBRC 114257]|nr:hypothetical protein Rhsp01_58730 [Rhizobium sp. NBRC 114257]
MGEITVVHDISHGLKANQQITIDGLRRRGTDQTFVELVFRVTKHAGWRAPKFVSSVSWKTKLVPLAASVGSFSAVWPSS